MTQLANHRAILPALAEAARHHQAGRLGEAENLYRQILSIEPNQVEVIYLLGALCAQADRHEAAVELFNRAIDLKPDAVYFDALGRSLKHLGRLDEAIAAYRKALQIKSDFANAQNNLGVALQAAGDNIASQAAFRAAIQIDPNLAEAQFNLGKILLDAGRFDEAVDLYRRVLRINPRHAEAWNNLGMALYESGKIEQSIEALGHALQVRPEYAEAFNNLGNAFRSLACLSEAMAAYQSAIRAKPNYAEAHSNFAVALWEFGSSGQAIASCQSAIQLKLDFAEAHNTLANALKDRGDFDGAEIHYRKALELKCDYAEAHGNLAVLLKDQSRLDEALEHARRAIVIRPDHAAHGNLIYLLHFLPNADTAMIDQEQANWHRIHVDSVAAKLPSHANSDDRGRRLRIGYIAPYFRQHVVGLNVLPLLREHDHSRFEIFCYSDVVRPDSVTEKCKTFADGWRDIAGLSDGRVAELIAGDRIDILVDLSLHLSRNRLMVLARKPAPVQAQFAGYPGKTGLKTIDYRFTDPFLDPPGEQGTGSFEMPIRLPSFWCYDESAMTEGIDSVPQIGPLPAGVSGFITFGCLNNFCKVNGRVLELWARVLRQLPKSRLLLLAPAGSSRQRAANRFAELGVDASRIEFTSHCSRKEYFALYNRIDIGLDTFPYNGHTTSLDSLWMGVPMVTLAGATSVGRAGVSQLTNLGMTELIAQTSEEFVQIAQKLATDLDRLGALRSNLREKMRNSPIMDSHRFAREIEIGYGTIWKCRRSEALAVA